MLIGSCGDIDCVEDCNGCGMVREYEEEEVVEFEGLERKEYD